eukprot:6033868-Pyramimonas_sp.AAC.3
MCTRTLYAGFALPLRRYHSQAKHVDKKACPYKPPGLTSTTAPQHSSAQGVLLRTRTHSQEPTLQFDNA